MLPAAINTFAEERRAWIAAHTATMLFQKRRAEILGKQIRARDRSRIGVRPDPHDDDVTPPIVLRRTSSASSSVEIVIVTACGLAAPVGWAAGWLLYRKITTLIPDRLLGYPIAGLIGIGLACGLPLPMLYNPAPSIWSVIVIPWFWAQFPATFLAAGIYGVLEGWLVVEGSSHWWPLRPVAGEVDDEFFLAGREVAMPTLLDPPKNHSEKPIAIPRVGAVTIQWAPMLTAAIPAALATGWYCWRVATALLQLPTSLLYAP